MMGALRRMLFGGQDRCRCAAKANIEATIQLREAVARNILENDFAGEVTRLMVRETARDAVISMLDRMDRDDRH